MRLSPRKPLLAAATIRTTADPLPRPRRESITSGGAGCGFEAALLLDALIGERGHFREMAEGRLVGYLEEVERALDAYFDRGFEMVAKLDQRELANRLLKAAYDVRASELPPSATDAALAPFFDAIRTDK